MEDPCGRVLNVCHRGCSLQIVLRCAALGRCKMNSALPFSSPGYVKCLVFALALGTKEEVVTDSFMPPCSWDDLSYSMVCSSGLSRYSNHSVWESSCCPLDFEEKLPKV